MSENIDVIELCQDCTLTEVNGEPGPPVADGTWFTEPVHVTPGLPAEDHVCEWDDETTCNCEHDEFATTTCGRCGTHLAGYRHKFTVWS